ncbi:hypothetical protein TSMEX_007222 [Taenia solium]|eukprot:TsM_000919400 transcript=TsM_000919400 gene=TsM_000919400
MCTELEDNLCQELAKSQVKWAPDNIPDAVQADEVKEDLMSEVIKYTIEVHYRESIDEVWLEKRRCHSSRNPVNPWTTSDRPLLSSDGRQEGGWEKKGERGCVQADARAALRFNVHAVKCANAVEAWKLNACPVLSLSGSTASETVDCCFRPPITPSSLEHTHQLIAHQRYPSFTTGATGGVYPTDQSIHHVAAPNPHRYITDDPLGAAAATAALNGSLPPDAVSPHSLTGKSIAGVSEDRGGAGSSTYASSGGRVLQTGTPALGHHSSPRMITSFYSPPRPDVDAGAINSPGPHVQNSFGQVPQRNSSFGTPDRACPIEYTSIGRNLATVNRVQVGPIGSRCKEEMNYKQCLQERQLNDM